MPIELSHSSVYYKESGRFKIHGPVLMLVGGCLLESGNREPLQQLNAADVDGGDHTSIDINLCSHCEDFSTVTVNTFTVKTDKKGNEKTEKDQLVENLIIPASLGKELIEKFSSSSDQELESENPDPSGNHV